MIEIRQILEPQAERDRRRAAWEADAPNRKQPLTVERIKERIVAKGLMTDQDFE